MEPRLFSLADFGGEVRRAASRIRGDIVRTPVEFSPSLSRETGARVFLKWESEQVTGSFKLRGALNKLRSLGAAERARGVVSASTGNHGLAISFAARREGIELTLFLPETASPVKRQKIERLGVVPELFGTDCQATEIHARTYAERTGRVFVSPYNDWDIIFGAGTAGLEVAEDVSDAGVVLVPVGGGGLIAGIAGYLRGFRAAIRTIGVEPETSAFMAASLAAGRLVDIPEGETIADAVAGGIEPGAITFPLCRDLLAGMRTVSEKEIRAAMGRIYETHGRVVEGAGALPVAALLASPREFRGETVVAVVSGGNVSPEKFHEATGFPAPPERG